MSSLSLSTTQGVLRSSGVYRRIGSVQLDVHPVERALIISYELECALTEGDEIVTDSAFLQRTVRVRNLETDTDMITLAADICDKNPQLLSKAQNLREVEQLLNYLRTRKEKCTVSSPRDGEPPSVSIIQLDKYVDDMYEDEQKVDASSKILYLAQNTENLEALTKHEVLLGALARTLREEGHRSYSLASNILNFFQCLSRFSTFASVIADYKIGSLTMDLLHGEMTKTEQVLHELEESQLSNDLEAFENLTKSYTAVLHKQDTMLVAAFGLLLNISSELKNETRIVNKGIIPLLTSCLDRKSRSLLLIILTFLVKLSIYQENLHDIGQPIALDKVCQIIPTDDADVASMTLRLIHNLSFNADCRCALVNCGLLPKLVAHLGAAEKPSQRTQVLRILLLIAEDSRFIAHFAYTDAAHVVLSLILEDGTDSQCSVELAAVAQTLASSLSCAQIICERNGLKFLVKRALKNNDSQLLKVVRNISMHEGPSKQLFLEHVDKFAERLIIETESLTSPLCSQVAVECARILANLDQIEFLQDASLKLPLTNKLVRFLEVSNQVTRRCMLAWLTSQLGEVTSRLSVESKLTAEDDPTLDLLSLCATYAENDPEIAAAFIDDQLTVPLLTILNACQENDTVVVHVLWVFYCLLRHGPSRETALSKTPLAGYLLDLLNDANKAVQLVCDAALDLLTETGTEWAARSRAAKFSHFNAQWIDMVEGAPDPQGIRSLSGTSGSHGQGQDGRSSSQTLDNNVSDDRLYDGMKLSLDTDDENKG
ncbi:kinesin-associated protein 3-like [Tropilaelaps mercedesae]|uniref:Kinesin-associated protein 3-like n=1 Tax=Tropilaelaps mercedesae TaxID=418985 RepID=A0A1V9XTN4_9ACAR|nr:kinesin-associated protein 3-like [Tropilaelaps mercedesae]